ncbi:hypothetical protein L484_014515 [Morus notabilis]|uniref:Uncharacterized protein n=1 Tax=Morus notabilis TaxID=981085 RepID=W9S6Z4_9ROSA|nr:hypothetical protein L484_014515 [Morus notabilis]
MVLVFIYFHTLEEIIPLLPNLKVAYLLIPNCGRQSVFLASGGGSVSAAFFPAASSLDGPQVLCQSTSG